jgi:cellobiose-specific phosphotransferase system component IIC
MPRIRDILLGVSAVLLALLLTVWKYPNLIAEWFGGSLAIVAIVLAVILLPLVFLIFWISLFPGKRH